MNGRSLIYFLFFGSYLINESLSCEGNPIFCDWTRHGWYQEADPDGALASQLDRVNQTAILLSPFYDSDLTETGCFTFSFNIVNMGGYKLQIYQLPVYLSYTELRQNNEKRDYYKLFEETPRHKFETHLVYVLPLKKSNYDFQIFIEVMKLSKDIVLMAVHNVCILQGSDCSAAQRVADNPSQDFDEEIYETTTHTTDLLSTQSTETSSVITTRSTEVSLEITRDLPTTQSTEASSEITTDLPTTQSTEASPENTTDLPVSTNASSAITTDLPVSTNASSAITTDLPVSTNASSAITTDLPVSTNASPEITIDLPVSINASSAITTDLPVSINASPEITTVLQQSTAPSAASTSSPITTDMIFPSTIKQFPPGFNGIHPKVVEWIVRAYY
ncbi:uncharacterized protein LOC112049598 [Bicyclus anynana]|uniref:Uncharacterized protein LOC112049598 n=1 Tax=Bicyclus anynana TaxID=110368 RepID=A0A6J1NJJ8_BICAN|nr:uncharacterized protein LOC112049598 [Bicyclus anynana]